MRRRRRPLVGRCGSRSLGKHLVGVGGGEQLGPSQSTGTAVGPDVAGRRVQVVHLEHRYRLVGSGHTRHELRGLPVDDVGHLRVLLDSERGGVDLVDQQRPQLWELLVQGDGHCGQQLDERSVGLNPGGLRHEERVVHDHLSGGDSAAPALRLGDRAP